MLEKYQEIKFKNLDWYVLDSNKQETRLLLKELMTEECYLKYCDPEKQFYYEVHSNSSDDWIELTNEDDYIQEKIFPIFIKNFKECIKIAFLSYDEASHLPNEILVCDAAYWTNDRLSEVSYEIWIVDDVINYGEINWRKQKCSSGIRPVITTSTELLLNLLEEGDKSDI